MLLQSKYSIPEAPDQALPRTQLRRRISESNPKVSTLVAPAGYGKTTLVADWAHSQDNPVAWYSLDISDNEASLFNRYLVESLSQATAGGLPSAQEMVRSGNAQNCIAVMTTIISDLKLLTFEIHCVFEDIHAITNAEIKTALNFLLKYLPPGVHLVFTSRSEPKLNLASMRMRGELTELNENLLALSADEVADFTSQRLSFSLSPSQVAHLTKLSEGWAPVVQLFCLSANSEHDCEALLEDIAKGHHHLLDYLAEEVFEQLDEPTKALLQSISVLERFDAEMARSLAQSDDASLILNALISKGLFIQRLDASNQWFRFHPLFATFLERNLDSVQRAQLHERAFSQWMKRNMPTEAIRHAIRAANSDLAVDLLEQFGDSMLKQGQHRSMGHCFDFIGDQQLIKLPELSLLAARVARNRYDYGRVETLLAGTERHLRHEDPDQWVGLEGKFATVRAQAAIARGEVADARELAQDALELLEPDNTVDLAAAKLVIGESSFCAGQLDVATDYMLEVEKMTRLACDWPTTAWSLCQQTEILFAQGKPHRAQERRQQAQQLIERHHLQGLPIAEFVHRLNAQLLWEWYDIDAAETSAKQAVANNLIVGERWLLQEYAVLAKVALARGDKEACEQWLAKLEQLLAQERYHADWVAHADYSRIAIFEALDDQESIERWLAACEPVAENPSNHFEQRHGRNHVRALMIVGRHADANRLLRRLAQSASNCNLKTDYLRNLVLIAHLKWNQNERAASLKALRSALELSEATDFIASFIRCGKPIIVMLTALAKEHELSDSLKQRLNRILEIAQQQKDLSGKVQIEIDQSLIDQIINAKGTPDSLKRSPLTPKEWQVLNLIHTGYSNGQIASHMEVAPSTIKTHIRALYQKLEARDRKHAIEIAEGLLRQVQGA